MTVTGVGRRFGETPLACVVLAAAVCAMNHAIVFGGRTFLPLGTVAGVMGPAMPWRFTGDVPYDAYRVDAGTSAWVSHPQSREVARAYAEGRLPLWNPHQGLGAPLAANAQSGAFDPLRIPVLVSSHPVVWDLYYLLRAYLGLVLTYLFARSIGLGFAPAVFAAIAYGFCGFLVIFGNTHFVEVYLLLPALLWATELLRGGRRRAGLLAIAAAVAITILAGMPEASLMTLLYGAAYGAYRMAWDAIDQRSWRAAFAPRYRLLVFGWLIGLGLAAPLIFPLAEYIGESFHIHAPGQRLGVRADLPFRLVLVAVPFLHGLPLTSIVLPGQPGIAWAGYSGAVVVVLAAAGAFSIGRGPAARSAAFFAGALVLLWAKFFGLPVVNELGRLPGLNLTVIPKWGSPLVSFSLALLAASAVHAACAARGLRLRAVAAALLALAVSAAILVRLNERWLPRFSASHLRETAVPALATVVLVSALLLVRRIPAPVRGAALCLAVFAELYVHAPQDVFPTRYDPLVEPPFVRYLRDRQQAEGPFRVFATGGLLYPNFATAFHIDDIRMLDALYPDRYFEYVRAFLADNVVDRYTGGYGSAEKPSRITWNKWLDAANVRFVIVPPGRNPRDGQAERTEPGPRQYVPVYRGEVDIYENQRALPRAFVAGAARVVRDRVEARAAMSDPSLDPAATVVLEASGAPSAALPGGMPSPAGQARIALYEPQRVEVEVMAERPGVLVLADAYYPGWEAELDGEPAHIHPADLAFRGVVVPAGTHRVVFRYRPASVSAALILAGISAAALAAALRSRAWTASVAPGPAAATMGTA